MAEDTKIQWANHTWSPWRGCTKVSDGCKNCYADKTAKRNPKSLGVWGPQGKRVVNANWQEPLKWNKQAEAAGERWRIFPSMCDPFEDFDGPMFDAKGRRLNSYNDWNASAIDGSIGMTMADVRKSFFELICRTPRLDWLVLTKRPENSLRMMVKAGLYAVENPSLPCPQPNLWLGTSVENQATADERIPHLLNVPAAVRFLSVEPLLGPIDLTRVQVNNGHPLWLDVLKREYGDCVDGSRLAGLRSGIDWVIVGGESGPGARPCDVRWIRDIVRQSKDVGVPCFVKQLGANAYDGNCDDIGQFDGECGHSLGWQNGLHYLRLRDPKGGDWNEWPEELRVREFPK